MDVRFSYDILLHLALSLALLSIVVFFSYPCNFSRWSNSNLFPPQAIARALYPRKEMVILDDTLNDLDTVTLDHIVTHVLGRNGLLRRQGTMTILATNSLNGE